MGRKKKPANIKKLNGTYREDRELDGAMNPHLLENLPEPPDWINEEAAEIWGEYGKQLLSLGVLRNTDLALFAGFCVEMQTYRKCTRIINEEGEWVEEEYADSDRTKSIKRHPAVMVRNAALGNVKKFSALFGLDPHSRQGIPTEKAEETDPLEAHMNKKTKNF